MMNKRPIYLLSVKWEMLSTYTVLLVIRNSHERLFSVAASLPWRGLAAPIQTRAQSTPQSHPGCGHRAFKDVQLQCSLYPVNSTPPICRLTAQNSLKIFLEFQNTLITWNSTLYVHNCQGIRHSIMRFMGMYTLLGMLSVQVSVCAFLSRLPYRIWRRRDIQ